MIRCPKCKSTNCIYWEKVEIQRNYRLLKKPKLNIFGNLSYRYSRPIKRTEKEFDGIGGYECEDCGH